MIEKAALAMATSIKKQVPDHQTSIEVMKYALAIIINTLSIICITILISVLTGNTKEALIILISFALLRRFTGGLHLKSGDSCVLFSTTLFTVLSFVSLSETMIMIMSLLCGLLILIFAPSGIEKQSRIAKKYYPLLKYLAIILIIVSLLISNSSITVAFFAQSLLLINLRGGEKK